MKDKRRQKVEETASRIAEMNSQQEIRKHQPIKKEYNQIKRPQQKGNKKAKCKIKK